ncbi:hypothetical protein TRAPUB_12998 [Trametes pubescens]|uniref:Uncharacterized protein n=1 Tax=Trametes pubescens TaxID=154538 RepID=A0A1M2VSP2_TRAPU|nr:hypothetical protein TRAPUB_12998 [Trametes pubescens]
MSNNAGQAAPTAAKAESVPAAAATDDSEHLHVDRCLRALLTNVLPKAKSVMSDTSTLAEDKKQDKKTASSSPKGGKPASSSKDVQLDSASAFAKEAAKKGWAAPTATRPTFG